MKTEAWCKDCGRVRTVKSIYIHDEAVNLYLKCGHEIHNITFIGRPFSRSINTNRTDPSVAVKRKEDINTHTSALVRGEKVEA